MWGGTDRAFGTSCVSSVSVRTPRSVACARRGLVHHHQVATLDDHRLSRGRALLLEHGSRQRDGDRAEWRTHRSQTSSHQVSTPGTLPSRPHRCLNVAATRCVRDPLGFPGDMSESLMPVALAVAPPGRAPGPQQVDNRLVSDSCAFCGSIEPLTREHVFGQWVSKIGLDLSPVRHKAGPLNGLPRDMGEQPPYRQTVKKFCASCNNGWMSQLEAAAQRVLTPLILGKSGAIKPEDQAVIAMWMQKTTLTAMLLSSKEQREEGYGLSQAEYAALYDRRDRMQPLEASRFWVGRYDGTAGFAAVHVTPLTVRIPGVPEPDLPQGYAMTIVLGELIVHGLRFTTPALEVDVAMDLGMPQLWPSPVSVSWPAGQPCTEAAFRSFAAGKMLRSTVEHVELRPWTHAAELPPSVVEDGKIKLPALCRKHFLYYPIGLLKEAFRGRFCAFIMMCECQTAYLIQTESDGAHCKVAGTPDWIEGMYEKLPGDEVLIRDQVGDFVCKMLPREAVTDAI